MDESIFTHIQTIITSFMLETISRYDERRVLQKVLQYDFWWVWEENVPNTFLWKSFIPQSLMPNTSRETQTSRETETEQQSNSLVLPASSASSAAGSSSADGAKPEKHTSWLITSVLRVCVNTTDSINHI